MLRGMLGMCRLLRHGPVSVLLLIGLLPAVARGGDVFELEDVRLVPLSDIDVEMLGGRPANMTRAIKYTIRSDINLARKSWDLDGILGVSVFLCNFPDDRLSLALTDLHWRKVALSWHSRETETFRAAVSEIDTALSKTGSVSYTGYIRLRANLSDPLDETDRRLVDLSREPSDVCIGFSGTAVPVPISYGTDVVRVSADRLAALFR